MKLKITSFLLLLSASLLLILASCNKDKLPFINQAPLLPDATADYGTFDFKGVFQGMENAKLDINSDVATLGRVLFYDKKLSVNNTISCGSCHNQEKAFCDNESLSKGFEGNLTARNTPAISNTFLQSSFFWDARTPTLKQMVLQPIENHVEMGMENMAELVEKLDKTDYYSDLFQKAYGSKQISKEGIAQAMAEYLNAMVSTRSKYDKFMENGQQGVFTAQEKEGFDIFVSTGQCQQCHGGPALNTTWGFGGPMNSSHWQNIGLDIDNPDVGVGAVLPGAEGAFKVPTLRNIALTGPYMHDGRFKTLMEVVEHYDNGVKRNPNLSPFLNNWNPQGEPRRLNLSTSQKEALVAFLKTLTDEEFISDKRFSDPFQ